MELSAYWKSVVDQDERQIVICDINHVIRYMNPAAVCAYAKHGGGDLIGQSLLCCHNPQSREKIVKIVEWFASAPDRSKVFITHHEKENEDIYMAALRDESGSLIGYYEKHECRTPEAGGFGGQTGSAGEETGISEASGSQKKEAKER